VGEGGLHLIGEERQRLLLDCLDKLFVVGEVVVGGGGRDPDTASRLTQHDGIWSALAG
jgi:hypothetical protein